MKFRFGDTVTWESQANAGYTVKVGEVCGIVNAGEKPSRVLYPQLYRPSRSIAYVMPRNHESYIIKVGSKYYWPRAKYLKMVKSVQNQEVEVLK